MLSRLNALFVNEQLKPFGLSTGQVACFAALLHSDVPLTQDEISTSLAIDPAATTRTVELLIKKGLAEKAVNPGNRRQKLVSATKAARDMENDFFEALKRVEKTYSEDLSEEEHRIAIGLMDRMIASAKRKKNDQNR